MTLLKNRFLLCLIKGSWKGRLIGELWGLSSLLLETLGGVSVRGDQGPLYYYSLSATKISLRHYSIFNPPIFTFATKSPSLFRFQAKWPQQASPRPGKENPNSPACHSPSRHGGAPPLQKPFEWDPLGREGVGAGKGLNSPCCPLYRVRQERGGSQDTPFDFPPPPPSTLNIPIIRVAVAG